MSRRADKAKSKLIADAMANEWVKAKAAEARQKREAAKAKARWIARAAEIKAAEAIAI